MKQQQLSILLEVANLPTAPFVERAVVDYIRRFVTARPTLALRVDRFGNVMVDYARGRAPAGGPLWLTAHMDHPGFVADAMVSPNRLRAHWFGGVALKFFAQAAVRFFVPQGAGWRIVRGRVVEVQVMQERSGEARAALRTRPQAAIVEVDSAVPNGAVGMWNLPDARVSGTRVTARAHDDLGQVAALLCVLDELHRSRRTGRVTCAFTRAEEVGFVGAIALAQGRDIPRDATFVSLECSDAKAAGAAFGGGPILRVGDLASTFDPSTLLWMHKTASDLAARPGGFATQRKLMPGGTCESTALSAYGFITGAMCLALANYHNMGPSRIASEAIDLRDFEAEITWLLELVAQAGRRRTAIAGRVATLTQRLKTYRPLLKRWC